MSLVSRKEHIRFSAQKLFREKGYAATSMRDLAKEVGVEAPSIYNHFNSKHELLKEICFDIAEQFFQAFNEAVENGRSNRDKLSAAIRAHVQVIYNNTEATTVFFEEWIFLEGSDMIKFRKLRNSYQQKFRDLIKNGIESKEFAAVDVRLATLTVLAALNATHELSRSNKKTEIETIANHITSILLSGITT